MRAILRAFFMAAVLLLGAVITHADAESLSLTGNLATPQSTFALVFTVGGSGNQTIVLQSWGFGGGTNAAGTSIAAGGFDPFLSLFIGPGPTATIFTDNSNPAGTADNLSNFTTGFALPGGAGISTFVGCGPAGTVQFSNGDSVCGDITMTLTLASGTYTAVLSDANNPANAVYDLGTLGEGFSGLLPTDSNGNPVFQTCDFNSAGAMFCITPTSAWAFDITDASGANLGTAIATPEPSEGLQLAIGLLALLGFAPLVLRSRMEI